jgi:hypothetical protein
MLLALRTNTQTDLLAITPSYRPCDVCKRTDGTCHWTYMSCFAEREFGDDAPIYLSTPQGMMDVAAESPDIT